MHRMCFLLFLFCLSVRPEATAAVYARNAIAQLPRTFEANQGQTAFRVKYLSRGPDYSVYFDANEVMIASPDRPAGVLRMKLIGVNRNAKIEPLDLLPGKSDYFIGSDPSKWRTDIPNYARVALRNVYPGIDLIFYGNQTRAGIRRCSCTWGGPELDPAKVRGRRSSSERSQWRPDSWWWRRGNSAAQASGVSDGRRPAARVGGGLCAECAQ